MKKQGDYVIQLAGLGKGSHRFDFVIDDRFFAKREKSRARAGKINLVVTLLKQDRVMVLDFTYEGWLRLDCDRCLDEFDFPFIGTYRMLVKPSGHHEEETDEIIITDSGEAELDLEQYIFEHIELRIPLRTVHPDDADGNSLCNKETLQILNRHLVQEEEKTSDQQHPANQQINNSTNQ
jgi:uncharacterized protein